MLIENTWNNMNMLIEHIRVVHECGQILYFLKRVLAPITIHLLQFISKREIR